MINIQINDRALRAALLSVRNNATSTAPLMRKIAGELHTQADMNMREQKGADGNRFASLAVSTQRSRAKKGKWPGQILQVDNILVRSITRKSTSDYAQIGSNIKYARIHQLGGQAGRGKRVKIEARPYLPFVNDALQDGMESVVLNLALAHLRRGL